MKSDKVQVGDIITSPHFAFGYLNYDYENNKPKNIIYVDGYTKHTRNVVATPRGKHRYNPETGEEYTKEVDLGRYDPSRGKAKFVVESAVMCGGGYGHGPNDYYPDGWGVTARRLNDDGSYNPDGELISFYQGGCFNTTLKEPLEVVGKMKRQVTFKTAKG